MSSNEDDYNEGDSLSTQGLKKRRIQRACDICRRKKIRCDGVQMPGNRCSNCVSYSLDCTYVEASKKRGPPKGYVESLENRVEKLDRLLRKLLPDPAILKEFQDSIDQERTPFNPSPLVAAQQHSFINMSSTNSIDPLTSAIRSANNAVAPPDDAEDEKTSILTDNLQRLALSPSAYRFFGKSSGNTLIRAAVELKQEYTQSVEPLFKPPHKPGLPASRAEFWVPHEWELTSNLSTQPPNFTFPDDDLALDLINLYFANINLYLPLLHRPTFEKSVAKGLHHTDERFACTYLLVCAIGARYSDDPRVLLDGVESLHSCGWKWFSQVQMVKKSLLAAPTLYDLQFYCLSTHFLQGSSAPQSCWTMVGIGIRLAQDVGAHRRKIDQLAPTAEDEQWKRGFWVLVCMDRMISAAMGRPCAIHDDDFDLDLPIDCDDEYWDHPDPEQRFKQPENRPSLISGFILFIKLNQVLSYCLRTIYAINKAKILFGYVGPHWEQHIVAELDSALNKWVDSVPVHLRWDPTREDEDSFNISAALYATYYHIQILIHRPFIPSPNKPSPLSFPSLAICTNAARSCSHVADVQQRRNRFPPIHTHMPIFTSGIVLLLSIWGGKKSGYSMDPNKEMTDVHKCMRTLRLSETRWRSVGRLWDILYELASVGDLPLPRSSPLSSNKRERDSDTPRSTVSSESPQSTMQDDSPRAIAGSRRVDRNTSGSGQSKRAGQSQRRRSQHQKQHLPQLSSTSTPLLMQPSHNHQHTDHQHTDHSMTSSVPPTPTYALPLYSDELGRLPLHGHMNFSAQSYLDQPNYWHQNITNNSGTGGGNESNSDHFVLPNSSHHSNRRTQDHIHVQPSHSDERNYSNNATTEISTITQGYSLNPTTGTENIMFSQPMPLTYIPPSYAGVAPPMNIVPTQNLIGGRSSHPGFQGISMGDRGAFGQRQESSQPPSHLEYPHHQHYHPHTQGQREQDIHNNLHHREQHQQQQQQPMAYSYLDNDTIAMWSSAPTGFELDEWGTYLSNMNESTEGTHSGGGQMNVR